MLVEKPDETITEGEITPPEEKIPEGEIKPPEEIDVVTIGDDPPPPEEDSSVIRRLRTIHKEKETENRNLRRQLAENAETNPVGVKPTLESCDHDDAKYEKDLNTWYGKKSEQDQRHAEVTAKQKRDDEAWQKKLDSHGEKSTALKVQDYDIAQETAFESLSITQQGLIIQAADNSANVFYALGRSKKHLEELSAIKDPLKFTAAMSKMEVQIKVTKRTPGTKPEGEVKGSGNPTNPGSNELEKLRAEAEKTGDNSKVVAYRKAQRDKA